MPDQPAASLVAVIMGSSSDWETMKHTVEMLDRFDVPHEHHIVSAHRTPVWMAEFASNAEARGVEIIVAGAGGAAHLPGMVAAHTVLPVLGVPVQSAALQGLDSLLSIVQMPGGVPVGTLAIGKPGAINAGLLAVSILATSRPELREKLRAYREAQTDRVRQEPSRPIRTRPPGRSPTSRSPPHTTISTRCARSPATCRS
jgi:5-(carboxyamino)imidazole ribonucleotide mutase